MTDTEHMERHIEDVRRLVALCASRGLSVTERDAYEAWTAYSDISVAGWMPLEDLDDDQLVSTVETYAPMPCAAP